MNHVNTIQSIDPETILQTNERPLIAVCDDLNSYYIKYHRQHGSANRLFNEYLAASLLPYWNLNHSDYAIVHVRPEDIPSNLGINRAWFTTPCFGIKIVENCFDLTERNIEVIKNSNNKQSIKEDILKIAFFDILMCNEDRHLNNLNLLAQKDGKRYLLYPIDHIAIFNQLNLNHELTELTFDDTLINSHLFSKMLFNRDLPRRDRLKSLKEKMYLCFENSRSNLNRIVNAVPTEWLIDYTDIERKLLEFCFNDEWFERCWTAFTEYLQLIYVNKYQL